MKILKVTKALTKALHSILAVYIFKYIIRVKAWIFLNETSKFVVAKSAVFHSI